MNRICFFTLIMLIVIGFSSLSVYSQTVTIPEFHENFGPLSFTGKSLTLTIFASEEIEVTTVQLGLKFTPAKHIVAKSVTFLGDFSQFMLLTNDRPNDGSFAKIAGGTFLTRPTLGPTPTELLTITFDSHPEATAGTVLVTLEPDFTTEVGEGGGKVIPVIFEGGEILLGDTTPPSAITDSTASSPTSNSIMLTWTAPGDDGDVGTASQYDIRYATSPITEGSWDDATECQGEPAPQVAGSTETFTVTSLLPETTYYFALKTADEAPNWSPMSNIAMGKISDVNNWEVTLVISADGLNDSPTFGVNASCTDGFDAACDDPEPPLGVGDYVNLYFEHPDWPTFPIDFTKANKDIRAPLTDSKTWEAKVECKKHGMPVEVQLSWPDLSQVPDNYSIITVFPVQNK